MEDIGPWLVFFASASVVVAAGTQLARFGDRIGSETGIGGLWIGAVLVASATSLPELVTDVSAAWIEEPDLAAGDLFGSSMANMMVLAIIVLLYRQRRVLQTVSLGQTLGGALAIGLTAFAAASISADLGWSIGHVGLDTIAIAVLFVLGARVVFRHEYIEARLRIAERAAQEEGAGNGEEQASLRFPALRSLLPFAVSAALILAAAPFVASSAADISDSTGIEASFMGATFLAITTSLPELATSLAAVRIGSFDLAVGNLFGSNAFNMFVFLAVDIAYRPGPISAVVSEVQVLTALMAVLLMATGIMGIMYRAERRYFLVEPDAAAMILAYIGGMWLVYQAGA